jgi:arginyl-tRNA synthetase
LIDYSLPIKELVSTALEKLFGHIQPVQEIILQPTKKEFEGVYTLVVFPYTRISHNKPEETARLIGEWMSSHGDLIADFQVVKGFLNLSPSQFFWKHVYTDLLSEEKISHSGKTFLVEYSSPNTNKPLHLGHLRNIFLGDAVANILEANGHKVIRTQIVNDRGIHICKSMLAWLKYGEGETPESSGVKGDKLVGKYYVRFDQEFKQEIKDLVSEGVDKTSAEQRAPIMREAQELLRKWEANDDDTYRLWQQMNQWVYKGFNETYEKIRVSFDKLYYESDTFILGKDIVAGGLEKGIFYKKEDGSVWIDLTEEGLDQKLVLRADGTAVYMTQDIGTANLRFQDYPSLNGMIYTVGNEQDYHFKVLFLILKKLGYAWAEGCYHLSYGMVDLPSGKMKSREGTVVDADELIDQMFETAARRTRELGKITDLDSDQAQELFEQIGLGALKYFILKVDPKKRMLFDPAESIDFNGNTGPFIQYTHARLAAIIRRARIMDIQPSQWETTFSFEFNEEEINVLNLLSVFSIRCQEAAEAYAPSIIANYLYDLAKSYNRFYTEHSIFNADTDEQVWFRTGLSNKVATILSRGLKLLGIEAPERM